jgi:hypothetical protein
MNTQVVNPANKLTRKLPGFLRVYTPRIEIACGGEFSQYLDVNQVQNKPVFPVSNERYTAEALKEIRSLRGIDIYLGICGGGTQHLTLLSLLEENNEIKSVVLVDRNIVQLANFCLIAGIHNHTKTNSSWMGGLKSHMQRHYTVDHLSANYPIYYRPKWSWKKLARINHTSYLEDMQSLARPIFSKPAKIELFWGEMISYTTFLETDSISLSARSGRYFMYLSDSLLHDMNVYHAARFLGSLSKNEAFREGSVIMSTGFAGFNDPHGVWLLRKDAKASTTLTDRNTVEGFADYNATVTSS